MDPGFHEFLKLDPLADTAGTLYAALLTRLERIERQIPQDAPDMQKQKSEFEIGERAYHAVQSVYPHASALYARLTLTRNKPGLLKQREEVESGIVPPHSNKICAVALQVKQGASLALEHYEQGKLYAASTHLFEMVKTRPGKDHLFSNAFACLFLSGKFDKAGEVFLEIIQAKPHLIESKAAIEKYF